MSQTSVQPTPATPAATPATGVFHWGAKGLTDGWANTFVCLVQKVQGLNVAVTEVQGDSRVTVIADETTLDIRQRNGAARDSIHGGAGSWKIVVLLLALGRHFSVEVADDASNLVSIRSLRKEAHLGFTEVEFDDLAEQLGLVNRTIVKNPLFAQFI